MASFAKILPIITDQSIKMFDEKPNFTDQLTGMYLIVAYLLAQFVRNKSNPTVPEQHAFIDKLAERAKALCSELFEEAANGRTEH